jgi:Na+/H+ antiporter NhaD/arsenite permease-like protein
MGLASMSLCALVVAIIASCTTKINVGVLSLVFAWLVGVYFGGMKLSELAEGFPTELFLTLAGVTLLFTQAQLNGTLGKVAHHALRSCRGNLGLIPIMFFSLALGLGSIGPGSIAAAALVAPMAMAVAGRAGIPVFLMAIMVGNGANASSLSPIAPTGIIVSRLMARIGLTGVQWESYFSVMLAHTAVAFAAYFAFGGWRLFARTYHEPTDVVDPVAAGGPDPTASQAGQPLTPRHWITLGVIGALIVGVIFFKVHVGMGALAGAVLLALFGVADDAGAIKAMPWGPILMVTGVTVLIALLEKTGGMDLFTSLLARVSSRKSVTGVTAFLTGTISIYSSTSGVVLPAFLPTVPGLIAKLGGGDPMAIASSINVGSHLVDVSPLSTTGALCIAAAPLNADVRALFRKMLAWGVSMAVVGAIGCYVVFGLLWPR